MTKRIISIVVGTLMLAIVAHEASAATCERENLFGITTYFTCPQLTDSREKQFCCGTKSNRFCCDSPFGIDDAVVKQFAEKLPVILGVIGALILGLIVVCVVCCCCCPFCLLHKHRNRGAIHNPNTSDVTVTQPLQPMQLQSQSQYPPQPYPAQPYPQQPYPPQQPGYPPQQHGYPPQQHGYPPQPGYPQQPYPPQGNAYPDLTEK